jgi:glycosyltransferase involved in cell wall biosynthesis
MGRKLRVAIDCRITDFRQGVGTAVLALAKAFSSSNVSNQEYTFIVRETMRDWLAPYIGGPSRLAVIPEPAISGVKAKLRWVAPLRFIWHRARSRMAYVPVSDGYVESQQFDLVHFPTQIAYLTNLPTIYQPHDLQHLHYPQFFSKMAFDLREREYRAFCDRASIVCVHAEWTKQDVIWHYGIPAEKVAVVPWGSVFDAYKSPAEEVTLVTVKKYALPDRFFFYPAVTWPHKNHENIIRSLAIMKAKDGRTPDVFFTGTSTDFRRTLDRIARQLGVMQQLHYLGFVSPEELQVIYRAATAMVYASKFEGFGLPILEAFQLGLPVLSSNASVLPEIAQDGALYFDPNSPAELAVLMESVLDSQDLRQRLLEKGTRVLSRYSFSNTAASFQALYGRAAVLGSDEKLAAPCYDDEPAMYLRDRANT